MIDLDLKLSKDGKILEGVNDTSLKTVNIPNSVVEIGYQAFIDCSSLQSVNIPNSVIEIHDCAFEGCSSLKSINIPDSVNKIGILLFEGCSSLHTITVDSHNPKYCSENGILYDKEKTCVISFPAGRPIIPSPFLDTVTKIGGGAFCDCSSFQSIDIPNTVTEIEGWAFSGCSSLLSVDLPNSVLKIGEGAFYECSSLQTVIIPSSVTNIENNVFDECPALKEIHCQMSLLNRVGIKPEAFYGLDNVTLFVPSGSIEEYRQNSLFCKFNSIEIE